MTSCMCSQVCCVVISCLISSAEWLPTSRSSCRTKIVRLALRSGGILGVKLIFQNASVDLLEVNLSIAVASSVTA